MKLEDRKKQVHAVLDAWEFYLFGQKLGHKLSVEWIDEVCVVDIIVYPVPMLESPRIVLQARGHNHEVLSENIEHVLGLVLDAANKAKGGI
jgi:hypothetical protein